MEGEGIKVRGGGILLACMVEILGILMLDFTIVYKLCLFTKVID